MLSIEKIKPLLESLGLWLELGSSETLYLYSGERLIGECSFEKEEEGHFHISRIDIDEECDRNKGYGSILMYATLSYMFELGATECTLTGFPSNFSFYVKNGFYDYAPGHCPPDETHWYQLSPEEKKDILYEFEKRYYDDKSTFFEAEEHLSLVFRFQNTYAIGIANQNIDRLWRYLNEMLFENLDWDSVEPLLTDTYEEEESMECNSMDLEESPELQLNDTLDQYKNQCWALFYNFKTNSSNEEQAFATHIHHSMV